jgi:hypothetical protein
MARRKTQTYGSAILADHGGRLSARHARSCSSDKRNMSACGDLTTPDRAFAVSVPLARLFFLF